MNAGARTEQETLDSCLDVPLDVLLELAEGDLAVRVEWRGQGDVQARKLEVRLTCSSIVVMG